MPARHASVIAPKAFIAPTLLIAAVIVSAQGLNPPAREVVGLRRALTGAEVASVLEASRRAVAGRVMHMAYQPDGPGPDFLMRSDGRPQYMKAASGRDFVSSSAVSGGASRMESGHVDVSSFTHFTGSPARGCDGAPRTGELVIDFENTGKGWTANARTRGDSEINGSAFEMLAGRTRATSGDSRDVRGRAARAFVAPYVLPAGSTGGPPSGTMQSLWLDVVTLLPVQWTLKLPPMPDFPGREMPEFGVAFTYPDPSSVDLQPPAGITPPDCVR
jgi:hypothetical protein